MKEYYKQNEDKIIKIQALFRGRAARRQYKNFSMFLHRLPPPAPPAAQTPPVLFAAGNGRLTVR